MCGKVLGKVNTRKNYKTNTSRKVTDALKSKNEVYTKADKSNSIAILDNEDYKQKLEELLEHGQYLKIQKIHNYMHNQFQQCLKKVTIIPKNEKYLN